MRSDIPRKQLILINALSRVKRASAFSDSAFRMRRQEVLATNHFEGRQFFVAMVRALRDRGLASDDDAIADLLVPEQVAKLNPVVLNFVAEPAQRSLIEYTNPCSSANSQNCRKNPLPAVCRNLANVNIGRLAWGAFSFGKLMHTSIQNNECMAEARSMQCGRADQLSLQDLSIIKCAACYQSCQFDYSFMEQLTADGATTVHRVAMMLANEFRLRVDTAIVTAAKLLVDPLVGGDGDHCRSMLKRRQIPASWVAQYGLD